MLLFPVLLGLKPVPASSEPLPSHGRTRITIMATANFSGAFELNEEGSRGWSVLKTYAERVKFNRRNAASRAYLFHTGDLTGLQPDSHDLEATPSLKETGQAGKLLYRKGVDLLQFTGFEAVALREQEERSLQEHSDLPRPGLVRFRKTVQDWKEPAQPISNPYRILSGGNTFVWVSAIEPAATLDDLRSQISLLKEEIHRNRAADLIVLLFASKSEKDSHDVPEDFQRLTPLQFLQAFMDEPEGNIFHPHSTNESGFPYSKMLILYPGERSYHRTALGTTICSIPDGEVCQIEFDFRGSRKSATQHWIGFRESMRNHSFLPADPGMEKILNH